MITSMYALYSLILSFFSPFLVFVRAELSISLFSLENCSSPSPAGVLETAYCVIRPISSFTTGLSSEVKNIWSACVKNKTDVSTYKDSEVG